MDTDILQVTNDAVALTCDPFTIKIWEYLDVIEYYKWSGFKV